MPADGRTTDSDYAQRFIEQTMPFVDQLYSGARRLTSSQYDAEDLVQETMLSGVQGVSALSRGHQPSRMAVSHYVQHLGQRLSRPAKQAERGAVRRAQRSASGPRRPYPGWSAVRRDRGVGANARRRHRRRARPATYGPSDGGLFRGRRGLPLSG